MGLGGSWDSLPLSSSDQKKADEVLETAINSGITSFDHADIYTFGKAEKAFGNYLRRHSSLRENLYIQSKTGIELHAGPIKSSRYNLSETYVLKQVDAILDRLSTEYLDALLLHRPDPLTSMEELAETLSLLRATGKVKSFGVSNMSVSQIQSLQHYMKEPLIANQIQLSLKHSLLYDLEVWVNRNESPKDAGLTNLISYSNQNKLSIQAYSPLANGLYSKSSTENETVRQTKVLIDNLAEKYKTGSSGILLAWLWRIPGNIQPIIGTTNLERIQESIAATNIKMTREDWYDLWIVSKGIKLP